MTKRIFARALACASMLTIAAGSAPASAQQIRRIVVFGDSYADTGNALRLAGVNPLQGPHSGINHPQASPPA